MGRVAVGAYRNAVQDHLVDVEVGLAGGQEARHLVQPLQAAQARRPAAVVGVARRWGLAAQRADLHIHVRVTRTCALKTQPNCEQ